MGPTSLSADCVRESLQRSSEGTNISGGGKYGYFRDIGYGDQRWSARVGDHHFNYAAGHGGQLIVLVDELDMVIVTTAYPFYGVFGEETWKHERAIVSLVGQFIDSLPSE